MTNTEAQKMVHARMVQTHSDHPQFEVLMGIVDAIYRTWSTGDTSRTGRHVARREGKRPIALLAQHGFLFADYPVRMRELEPCHCHDNVDWLWENRGPKSRVLATCTGYGLTDDDGIWRPHSWAMYRVKGVVSFLETTVVRAKYFGIVMRRKEAA